MSAVTDWDRQHLYRYRARLPEPIDGDSLYVLTDNGHRIRSEPNIRIAELFAPERWQEGGPEAKTALIRAVSYGDGSRWPLRVESLIRETVVEETRSFERYVSNILIAMPGGDLVNVKELL